MISVVIPVFNSAATLPELTRRLRNAATGWGQDIEIILVNDGSCDASWTVIEGLASSSSEIRGVNLRRNYGQHNALLAGVREARGRTILTMDDDLQHPPEEAGLLLAALTSDVDVVYGCPAAPEHGWLRGAASAIAKVLLEQAMGVRLARTASAFRAFRTELRDVFADVPGPFVNLDVLLSWGTQRFVPVAVRHDPRRHGRSNYPIKALARHAISMLTGFSALPLQMATLTGLATLFFGLLVLVWVVGRYLVLGYSTPGFPFLASCLAIFSGAQLLALGVIGEYVASIHFRAMRKPAYGIRQRTISETTNE